MYTPRGNFSQTHYNHSMLNLWLYNHKYVYIYILYSIYKRSRPNVVARGVDFFFSLFLTMNSLCFYDLKCSIVVVGVRACQRTWADSHAISLEYSTRNRWNKRLVYVGYFLSLFLFCYMIKMFLSRNVIRASSEAEKIRYFNLKLAFFRERRTFNYFPKNCEVLWKESATVPRT